jgi:hypothetical protein
MQIIHLSFLAALFAKTGWLFFFALYFLSQKVQLNAARHIKK